MASARSRTLLRARDLREWHRAKLLEALIAMCRRIARLQISAAGRAACRDVEQSLLGLLNREAVAIKRSGGRH